MKHKGRYSLRLLADFGLELKTVMGEISIAENSLEPKSVMGNSGLPISALG